MKTSRILSWSFSGWAALLLGSSNYGSAAEPVNPIRFVPDVAGQFDALTERPDPLGFYRGSSPDPTSCKHYQGMVRVQSADGTPYLLVTRSGNLPGLPLPDVACADIGTEDDQPGNLLIVRMGSRGKDGERLRSNRLKKGSDLVDTAPDERDTTVKHITFNGGEWGNYGHPGGMQAVGDIVVIALEASYSPEYPERRFLFVDVADPENPEIVNVFDPPQPEVLSGMAGITPLANGRYLMMVTGAHNETLWFFESLPTDGMVDGRTDLKHPSLDWALKDEWAADPGKETVSVGGIPVQLPKYSEDELRLGQDWPTGSAHQTLQFIREGDINGPLYLAGARGTFAIGEDRRDLYRVLFEGDQIKLELVSSQHVNSHPNADAAIASPGNNTANLAAASTYYVSPSGELIFYATEHDNDGPGPLIGFVSGVPVFNKSIKAGEWRHRDIVRPDSPTLLPSVQLFDPFTVNEGDSTVLSGLGQLPATKAWMQLFSDHDFGSRYVVIDFLDWSLDDFDDFKDLEGSPFDTHLGFNDEATSVRWFAPLGTQIRLNGNHIGDDPFPGEFTLWLDGTGAPEALSDLRNVANAAVTGHMSDKITSAQFLESCAAYYSVRPELYWDTSLNGSFSTVGAIAPFSAAALDGPSRVEVPVKAVHPDDGLAGFAAAEVRVLNVAPAITESAIMNGLGQVLGIDVPFFLEGLPLTVLASFTDPGKPDHQTAAIQWDAGVIDVSGSFEYFSDAFGGVAGELQHTHLYPAPGEYEVHVVVVDDDSAGTAASMIVPVLSAGQALEEVLNDLEDLITVTSDRQMRRWFEQARKAIGGSVPPQSQNGAISKLNLPNKNAALVKLRQALGALQAAQNAGADVSVLIALLEQVIASIQS